MVIRFISKFLKFHQFITIKKSIIKLISLIINIVFIKKYSQINCS